MSPLGAFANANHMFKDLESKVLNFFGADKHKILQDSKWNDWDVMDDDDVKDDPADFENQPELDDRDSIVIHDEEEGKEDDKEKEDQEKEDEQEGYNPSYISHQGE